MKLPDRAAARRHREARPEAQALVVLALPVIVGLTLDARALADIY